MDSGMVEHTGRGEQRKRLKNTQGRNIYRFQNSDSRQAHQGDFISNFTSFKGKKALN